MKPEMIELIKIAVAAPVAMLLIDRCFKYAMRRLEIMEPRMRKIEIRLDDLEEKDQLKTKLLKFGA